MTAAQRAAPAPPTGGVAQAESRTPTGRQWWRRRRGWVITAALVLVVAVGVVLASGGAQAARPALDPTSPAPAGALAINRVLADRGVDAALADSLDGLEAEVDERTTVLVHDRGSVLEPWQWDRLRLLPIERLVIIPSGFGSREAFADVAEIEGSTMVDDDAPLAAGAACPEPLAGLAPTITDLGGAEWRPVDGAAGCWQVRDGYRVVIGERDGIEVVVLGAPEILSNELLPADANAAAAINLLGASERFVWYAPGPDDIAAPTGPSYGSFIPQWLLPGTLLVGVAGLAALFWRGRRFGPLVAERLPVAVPASETLEGRARLYDHAGARLRALDSVRIGTVARLARLLGLGRDARVEAVAEAAAAVARVPREHAHRVLVGAAPADDAELVDLANACAELERRVRAATGRTEPTARSHRRDPE